MSNSAVRAVPARSVLRGLVFAATAILPAAAAYLALANAPEPLANFAQCKYSIPASAPSGCEDATPFAQGWSFLCAPCADGQCEETRQVSYGTTCKLKLSKVPHTGCETGCSNTN